MPFNGSGTFSRVYSWVADAANGLFISSSRTDTDSNDIAAGLTNCVTRDGQSPATADLPMGAHKITNLANGTVATDACTYGQVFTAATVSIAGEFRAGNGLVGAPSLSFASLPTVGFYTDGSTFFGTANGANTLVMGDGALRCRGDIQVALVANGGTPYVVLDVGGVTIGSAGVVTIASSQVVGTRKTGYSAMTGVANRATVYDTSTITLPQLAQRMKALLDDLTLHGLIG